MSKIVTVFGASGNQGGSVVTALLSNPELSKMYKVRAVTRDTTKPAALKLKERGAEVVKADMNDAASLAEAVKGAYAVFGVTNFWEGMDGKAEQRQGRAIADAAVAAGVKFFIFSSLPNVTRVTKGHLTKISHFDNKAEVEDYVRTLPIQSAFYWPAFYMSNLLADMGPRKNEDGSYTLASVWAPDSKFPMIDIAADTGKFVAALLLDPAGWNGRRIYGAGGFYTPQQLVDALAHKTGKKVTYAQVPDETYKGFLPSTVADELYENMVLMRDYQYYGPEGKGPEGEFEDAVDALAKAGLKPTSWQEFVDKNSWFQ